MMQVSEIRYAGWASLVRFIHARPAMGAFTETPHLQGATLYEGARDRYDPALFPALSSDPETSPILIAFSYEVWTASMANCADAV